MGNFKVWYHNEDDGCTYCWDETGKRWLKLCPVDSLPLKIRKKVIEDQESAETLLSIKF